MIKPHRYIEQRKIIQTLNAINVAKESNSISKERIGIKRLLDGISGDGKKRQDLINSQLIVGLDNCVAHLQDHSEHLTRIDGRICDLSRCIENVQNELMRFYGNYTENVKKLEERIDILKKYTDENLKSLRIRIEKLEIGDLIAKHIDWLDSVYGGYPIEYRIYACLDDLFSGEFGYLFDKLDEKEKKERIEQIRGRLISYLESKGIKAKNTLNYKRLTAEAKRLTGDEKQKLQTISYLNSETLNKQYQPFEASCLVNLTSAYHQDKALKYIDETSDISEFFEYEDYIKSCLRECWRKEC